MFLWCACAPIASPPWTAASRAYAFGKRQKHKRVSPVTHIKPLLCHISLPACIKASCTTKLKVMGQGWAPYLQ